MASQIAGLLNSGYFWLSVKSESSFTNWSIAFAHLQLTDWAVNLLSDAAIGGDVLRLALLLTTLWKLCFFDGLQGKFWDFLMLIRLFG